MKNSNLPEETGKTRASSSLELLQDAQPLKLTSDSVLHWQHTV